MTILESGFEEIEAITPVDLLRRAGVEVNLVSVGEVLTVKGKTGVCVQAERLLRDCDTNDYEILFLPGGPAVQKLRTNPKILELVRSFHENELLIAAICAASLILKDAGVLSDRSFTAHPSTLDELPSASKDAVVVDRNLITSQGAGTAVEFGLTIIRSLLGQEKRNEIADSICFSANEN